MWNGIPTELIKRCTSDINASSDIEIYARFLLIRPFLLPDSTNIKTLILFSNGLPLRDSWARNGPRGLCLSHVTGHGLLPAPSGVRNDSFVLQS